MITEILTRILHPMFATRDGGGFAARFQPIARISRANHILFLTGGAL
jgi:hypothetical protein